MRYFIVASDECNRDDIEGRMLGIDPSFEFIKEIEHHEIPADPYYREPEAKRYWITGKMLHIPRGAKQVLVRFNGNPAWMTFLNADGTGGGRRYEPEKIRVSGTPIANEESLADTEAVLHTEEHGGPPSWLLGGIK